MSYSPTERQTRRRPLLLAIASGAAAVTGIAVAGRTGVISSPQAQGAALRGSPVLTAGEMAVESLALPLTDDLLTAEGARRWSSRRLATTTHSMVGFNGAAEGTSPASTSARVSAVPGSPGRRCPTATTRPTRTPANAATRWAPTWPGSEQPTASGFVSTTRGRPILTLVLLYPRPRRTDETTPGDRADGPSGRRGDAARAAADGTVPPPTLLRRRDWGANEKLRERPPAYIDTIQQVHVHHTVNSNNYTRADVPALIRGMYVYHTQSLGWSDIGYNFLVDRFGRIWVGRAGGAAKPVRGAHTLGFNGSSTGVSVIGNFDVATPSRTVIRAIARVAAWKLHMYDGDPEGRTTVTSEGSDKFPYGRRVGLPVIDGHRDTNDTACPGQNLYDALPAIRRRTRARMDRFMQPQAEIAGPFRASGQPLDGESLTVEDGTWTPPGTQASYTWMRDGVPIRSAGTATYAVRTADVGSLITVRVDIAPEGYRPSRQTMVFPGPVKARTILDVRARGRRGRAVVRVTAWAPGLGRPPSGSIDVTVSDRIATATLVDGAARVVVRHLQPGTYQVRVSYPGDGSTSAATGSGSVTVMPLE